MMLVIIIVVVFMVVQHLNEQKAVRRAELDEAERELALAHKKWDAAKDNSAVEIATALLAVVPPQLEMENDVLPLI